MQADYLALLAPAELVETAAAELAALACWEAEEAADSVVSARSVAVLAVPD